MEIFIGMMIIIDAVHLLVMVWRLIVNLWLPVGDRHNRVVRVNDRLRLNRRSIVGFRVMEGFGGRLIHWLNLGNIDGFGSMVHRFGCLIDGFGSMVYRFGCLVDWFGSMIHRFGCLIDGFRSLIDGFMVTQSRDVVMLEPTLYTVRGVIILVERLRDIRWS